MATETIPKTMKALLQPDPASLHLLLTDLPVPVPKPGSTEHLVRVHAAALTNGELLWRHNFPLPPSPDNPTIFIPLFDIAGTILTSPPHSPFPPGTEIYTRTSYTRTGSGSQYTLVTTAELAVRPQILSWAESATVPMSAMTAWQALFVHAGLTPTQGAAGNRDADGDRDRGKKVFVMGASGGVGIWVVQLARWAGLEVGGTARADNREFVEGLGA
ncbi:putative zinc-binding oxidoreductase, mitochondrial, partial [Lachnellula cervina]